jgi:hypothetical protein
VEFPDRAFSLPILAHFLGGLDGALGLIASPYGLGGWVAAVVAVVAGEGGDDLVVEGLPEGLVVVEVEEDGAGVAVDEELEVGWVLAGGGFPEVLVAVEVEEDGGFLALGVGEELDAGEVDGDFVGVAAAACGLAKVVFGEHFAVGFKHDLRRLRFVRL